MLFSSMTFIYIFLPIVLILYFSSNKKYHNMILLISSIIFYALGALKYIPLLFGIIFINYIGALAIQKYEKYKKLMLLLTITINLSSLIYFKYFNFIIDNINHILKSDISFPEIILPIGISFYTFQAMSYIIDVYRGEVKAQKNLYNIALYICLFPQLVAGPIIKYHDISDQIKSREINPDNIVLGIKRFIIGLSKKMLIANFLGITATKVFSQDPYTVSHFQAWIGGICYGFQIYFDFSGYSDMAIGLGLIFGFKFMENFNYPYISRSMSDFWRRWNISLCSWFKSYVYIPLGGSRLGKLKTIRNLLVVFFLTGLWHGTNWIFIIWGLWNGLFVILEKIINLKKIEEKYTQWWVKLLQHCYFLLIIIIATVIFRSNGHDIDYTISYIKNMFGLIQTDTSAMVFSTYYYLGTKEIVILIIATLCSTPLFKNITNVKNKVLRIFANLWILILFILSTISIAATTYNPFIYFRF